MDKSQEELKFWLALSKTNKVTPREFLLLNRLNVPISAIFELPKSKLHELGLDNKIIDKINLCKDTVDPDAVLSDINSRRITVLTLNDPRYPVLLKEIYDPPFLLYVIGNADFNRTMVGVVGSRISTGYGREATQKIVSELAANGITIVSGMAYGIDSIAHEAAIAAKSETVAVLGCGLDRITAPEKVRLATAISQNGAVISEYPIGTPPAKFSFPRRNRIIAGLCKGLIVSEAAEKSGSLITATCALEQNREVFAIPGSIFNKNSFGTNNLIKMGAKLVVSGNEILSELGFESAPNQKPIPKASSAKEEAVIQFLLLEPAHVDAIAKETKIESANLNSVLTLMEISGKVKHVGGMVYRLNI